MDKATVMRMRLLFMLILAGLFIIGVVAGPYGIPDSANIKVSIPSPRTCYFNVEVRVDSNLFGVFPGWCVDLDHTIYQNTLYTASLEVKETTGTWGKINWILNNNGSTWKVTQMAIWLVLGYSWDKIDLEMNKWGSYTPAEKNEAIEKANAADPNFIPPPGKIVAVFVDVQEPPGGTKVQEIIFEYPKPSGGGPGVPEFSEGVPAIALLSLVSYVILKRRLKAN
ncbi:MAG: thioester domain-containing protein [Candidatus Brockarchaeota archaeon]|nr:thioester domain-containing protein [Candidatus Brockarchaeota archaeon]